MCTRVLWNKNQIAVVASRTMDWPESTMPEISVFPRQYHREGGKVGGVDLFTDNPLRWESKFGSVVTTVYGIGTADGMNERGFAAHMLYLPSTDFGERDTSIPALHAGLWAQYILDCAESVEQALELMEGVQIVMAEARGKKATVHLAIEDASGDSAVIEFADGEKKVYHDRDFAVLTNDPPFDQQLKLLREQDFSHPSRDMPLPGNINPVDRFQRASYYTALLPEPANLREAVAGVLAIARNVSVPFGAPYHGAFATYNTEYRTVVDLTNRTYFFELTTNPSVIWVSLDKLDFSAGAPVLRLDPDSLELHGDVTSSFEVAERVLF